MKFKLLLSALSMSMLLLSPLHAEEDALKAKLLKAFGRAPDVIAPSAIEGLKEVVYGTDVYYITPDGRYLVSGSMFDLTSQKNLTEQRLSGLRTKILEGVDESSMIVFKADGKQKHVITVFTDIDCVYCRKLHSGMAQMNKLGITVRYMAYPRAGIGSPSYEKAVSVWCAKDRNKAMNEAKNDGKVVPKKCENPVAQEFKLGQKLGVNGTPAILLEDGHLMPGYAPPERLFALLENKGKP
jgi:thiol:disulfide interchange protein DsbC